MAVNRIAYLLAGAVLGAAGTALIKEGKGENLLQSLVHGGHDLTEKLLGTVETIKEDVEDYLAEAQYAHEEKLRQTAEAEAAAAGVTGTVAEEATKKKASTQGAKKNASAAASKKSTTKKSTAKKSAAKKSTDSSSKDTKKTTKKKSTASKKTTDKKSATKKAGTKKATAKKTTAKSNASSAKKSESA